MDSFPTQNYENKMETFETYNESIVTAANHQREIAQTQSVNSQTPTQQMQVQSQENRDTLALQQQQQTHQMTQLQSNAQQSATLTPVRLPAILDGEYFTVTRVEDTNVTVRCQQCQKLLNGNLKSTGNFLSHIKVN
ncbi:protein stand still [Lasius niger]|uniref:Protein stand still n=1 Tax=Lasius niger TaxID=67767 RepID=A0A0J7KEH7_LASNI|nr:protein stand still [Lasius niger]